MLEDGVSSQQLFELYSLRPARPVPRPVGESRTACHSAHSRTPLRTPEIAPFLCMPRMSYTIKDFNSCRINTYKKLLRFSHLIENAQLQVLYNQHLRVFASQVLWIQHLHKNRGGVPSELSSGGAFPASPRTPHRITLEAPPAPAAGARLNPCRTSLEGRGAPLDASG